MTAQQFDQLSNQELRAIDDVCDAFESKLQQHADPSIETQLASADDHLKPRLLQELLVTELEYRRKNGGTIDTADYRERFPDQEAAIQQAFDEVLGDVADRHTRAVGDDDTGLSLNERRNLDTNIPSQIGRYKIEHLLGRGGMGAVYLARDTQLDRQVAIKVPEFDSKSSKAQAFIERFNREARAMATVEHPNLCPIYDVGEFDGHPFLAMAYVKGQTLSARIGRERVSVDESLRIVRTLAEALQVAHDAGVVHRDLKPSNVMINDKNQPVIMDFGLAARDQQDEADLTNSGTVIGSPAYMAPEQVRADHERIGPQTDIYSLGVILYELLSGRRPFEGANLEVLGKIVSEDSPKPLSSLLDINRKVAEVCNRAMSPEVEDRYQNAGEFASALAALSGASLTQPTQPRRHAIVGLVSAVAVAVAFLGAWSAGLFTPHEQYVLRDNEQIDGVAHNEVDTTNDTAQVTNVVDSESNTTQHSSKQPLQGWPASAPRPATDTFDAEEARVLQQSWAEYLNLNAKRGIQLPSGQTLAMILIPPGKFLRGSPDDEQKRFLLEAKATNDAWSLQHIRDEGPQRQIVISRPFYLGKCEVTQQQWAAVMQENPPRINGDLHPVASISWQDVQRFLAKLNDANVDQDLEFVLPTEAQWEYACRAGTSSAWHHGSDESMLQDSGWIDTNSSGTTHAVGGLTPNAFGLHDMHGNVMEFCADWSKDSYYADSPTVDPTGPDAGTYRIRRGGSALQPARYSRSARRSMFGPDLRAKDQGFRLAAIIRVNKQ